MFRVLVVEDDETLRLTISSAFTEKNYTVNQVETGEEAVIKAMTNKYDLVLLDVNLPGMSGLDALKEIKEKDSSTIVIMLTAYSNVKDAVAAVKLGAYNYLEKPIKSEDLIALVDRALKANNMVRAAVLSSPVFKLGDDKKKLIGTSVEMQRIFSLISKLTTVDTSVLIRGKSGTGKELVARAIHMNGTRKDERFVAVNCSAIPENLIESEFFGHEKGAFTGADSRKLGKFQYANGGTLFLDEIGDLCPHLQVKLLRALQERKFTPVGSNRDIEVNVRIIAATNRNLEKMIETDEFREDLFYRLNVLPIYLPSLTERKDDIPALLKHFVDKFNKEHGGKIANVAEETLKLLTSYAWPGNIRELENVVEHAFVMENSSVLTPSSLPSSISGLTNSSIGIPSISSISEKINNSGADKNVQPQGTLDFQAQKQEFEKNFIINALKKHNGKINQTALHANIPKKTLLRKLEKYSLRAKDYQN